MLFPKSYSKRAINSISSGNKASRSIERSAATENLTIQHTVTGVSVRYVLLIVHVALYFCV